MEQTAVMNAEPKEVIDNRKLITFGNLMVRSDKIQQDCHDYNVTKANTSNFRFNEYGGLTFIPDGGGIESMPMSRHSMTQLGTKIGVPARYLQKCIDSGRLDLAADNVNSWLQDYDKDLFIREYNGHVRGVLSSKYSVCDTPQILDVLNNAVDMSKYNIKGHFLNEERLHLRLVGRKMLPIDGEDLFPGLYIDSSDVGRNVLTVVFGIYKQVCTNGLVVSRGGGVLFEQKHIGISADEFYEGLVASLKNVDVLCDNAVALVNKARDMKTRFNVSRMSKEDIEAFLAQIKGHTKLSNEGAAKVIDLMQNKYGGSRWGYINSVTEVAQDFTLERRLELERIAGDYLWGIAA